MANKLVLALVVLWEFCSPVLSASASGLQLPCFTSYLADPVSHLQDEPSPQQILGWRSERALLRQEIIPRQNISIKAYNAAYTTLNGLQLQNVSIETSDLRQRIAELTELILNATQPNSTEPEVLTEADQVADIPDESDFPEGYDYESAPWTYQYPPAFYQAELSPAQLQIVHGRERAVFGWRLVNVRIRRILRERYPVDTP